MGGTERGLGGNGPKGAELQHQASGRWPRGAVPGLITRGGTTPKGQASVKGTSEEREDAHLLLAVGLTPPASHQEEMGWSRGSTRWVTG